MLPGGNGHLSGNIKVDDVVFIGSHNAACSKAYGWVYAQQSSTISQQIEKHGARFFKIPLHWFYPGNGICAWGKKCKEQQPYIAVAHEANGANNCRLSTIQRFFKYPRRAVEVFTEIAEAAEKYPKEVFIIKIESYLISGRHQNNNTNQYSNQEVAQKFDQMLNESNIVKHLYKIKEKKKNLFLKDLRKGRNILLFLDERALAGEEVIKQYAQFAYDYICQTDWAEDPVKSTKLKMKRCKYNDHGITNLFFEAHFNPEASLFARTYRNKYNKELQIKSRYEKLTAEFKKKVNFICSDYICQGDLIKVVNALNEQLTAEEEKSEAELKLRDVIHL